MSIRTFLVILLAIGCGLSSALGLNMVLATQRSAPTTSVETVPIVVAKKPIERGRLISAELLEVKDWPKQFTPPGAVAKLEDASERAALQAMLPGEPILEAKLAAKGAIGGMASIIPPGKRAYTIQTKTYASKVAGFVLPGNYVDVLLTFRSQNFNDETGGGTTTTLLQAVEVLAVGKNIEPVGKTDVVDAQEIESVTLLVTPEEATRLDLGQSLGMLSLSLRNPHDKEEAKTTPATIADIRFSQMKPNLDPTKLMNFANSLVSAFSFSIPRPEPQQEPQAVAVAPPQEAAVEAPSTAILTLRGQTWGAIRVSLPEK